jgi:uncharacterized protein
MTDIQNRLGEHPASETENCGLLGKVIAVSGSTASVAMLSTALGTDGARVTVSKFVMVHCGRSQVVGLVTGIFWDLPVFARQQGYDAIAELNLMGEINPDKTGAAQFRRAISNYPGIGDPATLLTSDQFRLVYKKFDAATGTIGTLHDDPSMEVYINVNELLSKHFAVLGTTGVGKSCGVAVILQQALQSRPDLRIFLLDAHNEYGKCFGEQAQVLNPINFKLPFWLFDSEEIVDVFFAGRPRNDDEIAILLEIIPLAKSTYWRSHGGTERSSRAPSYTTDTPVPYRLTDLLALIEERMGKLENHSARMTYYKLLSRIDTVHNDPRNAFMFENANVGGDTFADLLIELFRLIPNGKPTTVIQLAGLPVEVVDAVIGVLGRMAIDFGLWSEGASPLLFVCEEAHRYISADRNVGFGLARRAFARIAKEGRKYAVFLGLVTQRPSEVDATILAQCNTLFAMRLSNERDHAIVRAAVSDAATNLLNFVPSLGTREVFAFGEGVALPTRLTFMDLPPHCRPHIGAVANWRLEKGAVDQEFVASVVERWRGSMTRGRLRLESMPSQGQLASPPYDKQFPQSKPLNHSGHNDGAEMHWQVAVSGQKQTPNINRYISR